VLILFRAKHELPFSLKTKLNPDSFLSRKTMDKNSLSELEKLVKEAKVAIPSVQSSILFLYNNWEGKIETAILHSSNKAIQQLKEIMLNFLHEKGSSREFEQAIVTLASGNPFRGDGQKWYETFGAPHYDSLKSSKNKTAQKWISAGIHHIIRKALEPIQDIIMTPILTREITGIHYFSKKSDLFTENEKQVTDLFCNAERHVLESMLLKKSLQESEDNYHTLVDNLPGTVARIDVQGRFIFVNRVFLELTKMKEKNVIGRGPESMERFYEPESYARMVEDMKKVLAEKKKIETELRARSTDGKNIWLLQTAYPWYNKAGRFSGAEILTRDITDKKKAEEMLIQEKAYFKLAHDVSRVMNRPEVTSSVLDKVAQKIKSNLGLHGVNIALLYRDNSLSLMGSATDLPAFVFNQIKKMKFNLDSNKSAREYFNSLEKPTLITVKKLASLMNDKVTISSKVVSGIIFGVEKVGIGDMMIAPLANSKMLKSAPCCWLKIPRWISALRNRT
jgi:PAS domain S-box-containing protein